MALIDDLTCHAACGALGTSRLLLDRRGKPYITCVACGARTFFPNFAPCLNGLALVEPLARALVEEMARDKAAHARARERIAAFQLLLQARMRGDGASPTAATAPLVASAASLHLMRSK